MKAGYTFTWRWLAISVATIGFSIVGTLWMQMRTDALVAKRSQLIRDVRSAGDEKEEYVSFTPEKLAEVSARVEAITKQLLPPGKRDEWQWIAREWGMTLGEPDQRSGYDRIEVQLSKTGAGMSEWGALLRDLRKWEAKPGIAVRTISIKAAGGESARSFEQIRISLDAYFGK